MTVPSLTLHALPPSHPCMTAEAALKFKGLPYERVDLPMGKHVEQMAEVYGEGKTTVPGLLVGDEPVHGSRAILARLEELAPEPPLFPAGPHADAIRDAERWGDEELQDLGRRIPWGALYFRPEAMGTMAGGPPLDPAGTDFAMKFVRASWKYHKLTAVQLHEDLQGLPAKLDHVDGLIADGVIGGETPNAADLQIAPTLRVMRIVGDLDELFAGRPCAALADRLFPDVQGRVPAGAFPAGWVPSAS
ncbi:MAG TPA: glutathione S-transferase [Solirubrobacteraceae bacterium]|nr:glutathione S-transferase [Solirubrobacteraceae bacterium]